MSGFLSRSSAAQLVIATAMAVITVPVLGCNRRSPLPLDTGLTAPSPPVPPSAVALYGISLTPPALFGGAPSSGTAILTRQAPAGGVVVTLSSADPATATVPLAVTIAEGTDRAIFPISTQSVSVDRQITIAGSALDGSVSAPLHVWTVLPTFFSWLSDPAASVGRGAFGRLTLANATFNTSGSDMGVQISVNGGVSDSWTLNFSPPLNGRLRVGSYEVTFPRDATHAGMNIFGRGSSCGSPTGRFEVRELVFTTTQTGTSSTTTVLLFDATFEEHCSGAAAALRGEVRYTASAR
jgi:hypothetical protein